MIAYLLIYRLQQDFHDFVGAIKAVGGGDTPEDIMGALKVTFRNLSWRPEATKASLWQQHICSSPS